MTLRRGLQLIILIFAVTLVGTAGHRIVLASDGLLETQDGKGEEFGFQGLVASVISGAQSQNSTDLTNLIVSSARQDSLTWQRDDVLVVVITRRLGQ
jgi:serine phosphatase RsbU (regulator of sigma subunit)